jgi:hypothetical protein
MARNSSAVDIGVPDTADAVKGGSVAMIINMLKRQISVFFISAPLSNVL